MRTWPLRLRLCLWAVALGGATLMAIGAILAWRIRQTAEAPVDAMLRAEVAEVFDAIRKSPGPIEWSNPDRVGQVLGMVPKSRLVQIESPPGAVVYPLHSQVLSSPSRDHFSTLRVGTRNVRMIQELRDNVVVRLGVDSEPVDQIVRTLWTT